jgi:hypothetical protein
MLMNTCRVLLVGLPVLALVGCSSEALEREADSGNPGTGAGGESDAGSGSDAGGSDTGGTDGGGSSGSGGESGKKPAAPVDLPDFTSSPCYGQPGQTVIYNGETHTPETFQATCRGETDRVRLHVADALFDAGVTQAQVNGFLHRYELVGHEGSAHPDLGVLLTDEAVFGKVDARLLAGDKLPIFVIDTNNAGEGYLCTWCEGLELHLDGTRLSPLDGDTALSIAAHETFHLIHKSHDPNEESWVDESLAQAAMSVNGFFSDRALLNTYARQPNVNWGPSAELREFDYGAGLAFGTYLWEFGGEELMRAATSAPANGWAGLDAALGATGHAETASELFLGMAVALHLDDPERGHGFRSFDLLQGVGFSSASSGSVQPYGLVYYAPADGTRSIRLEGGTSLRAVLVADTDPVELTPLTIGTDTELSSDGLVLIVTNESTAAVSFSIAER